MTTVVKLRVRIAVVALTIAEVDRVVSGLRIDEDLRIARQWLPGLAFGVLLPLVGTA